MINLQTFSRLQHTAGEALIIEKLEEMLRATGKLRGLAWPWVSQPLEQEVAQWGEGGPARVVRCSGKYDFEVTHASALETLESLNHCFSTGAL